MRRIQIIAVVGVALLGGAAVAQTGDGHQSAADYFRHGASSASSSSSSFSAMAIYTSCKALHDAGGIPADATREEALQRARNAGCSEADVNALAATLDMLGVR